MDLTRQKVNVGCRLDPSLFSPGNELMYLKYILLDGFMQQISPNMTSGLIKRNINRPHQAKPPQLKRNNLLYGRNLAKRTVLHSKHCTKHHKQVVEAFRGNRGLLSRRQVQLCRFSIIRLRSEKIVYSKYVFQVMAMWRQISI